MNLGTNHGTWLHTAPLSIHLLPLSRNCCSRCRLLCFHLSIFHFPWSTTSCLHLAKLLQYPQVLHGPLTSHQLCCFPLALLVSWPFPSPHGSFLVHPNLTLSYGSCWPFLRKSSLDPQSWYEPHSVGRNSTDFYPLLHTAAVHQVLPSWLVDISKTGTSLGSYDGICGLSREKSQRAMVSFRQLQTANTDLYHLLIEFPQEILEICFHCFSYKPYLLCN